MSEAQPGPADATRPGPEDTKIITLARSARARLLWLCYSLVNASFPVEVWRQPRVPDSGAASLEAAVLVSDADQPDPADLAAVRDLGPDAIVFHAAPDGSLRATLLP